MARTKLDGIAPLCLAWVASDCLLSWSWVVVPGGADVQRAWHGAVMASLVLLTWGVAALAMPTTGRYRWLCGLCALLCVPVAIGAVQGIEWGLFALPAHARPTGAWHVANVAIAASFAVVLVQPATLRQPVAFSALVFGAVYCLLGPVQYALCGAGWGCYTRLGGLLPPLFISVAVATLAALTAAHFRNQAKKKKR